MECSRPNHSDHDSTDSIFSVSAPASESRDTIVIDCDRQEYFPSVCTSSIETDVKSFKTLCNKFGSFNKESHFRKHKSVASKSCYVCGSYLHLIKDCDLHEQRFAKRNAEGKGILERRPTGNQLIQIDLNQFLLVDKTQFLLVRQTRFLLDSKTQFLQDNSLRLEKPKDRGIVDSGCSRSMSGNKDKLEDFEDFDGGEVTFGDFPLPDPSMVILSIPRKHNLYTFSLNELAPKGPLTCLIAKALQNESTLWHKRLGHVNFKNMNKLLLLANMVLVTKPYDKTPYELLTRDKPSISYFKPFGCHVTILNTSDPLGKFDKKSDEGYIVGYSVSSKAYKVYKLVFRKIEETMNLKFLENKPFVAGTGQAWMFDIDYLTDSLNYSRVSSTNLTAGFQGAPPSNAVVPIVDEATTQNDGTKSDHAKTNADNLDELAELQAFQMQEQAGTEEADRLRLEFPSLNQILGVGTASIGSSISAGGTPHVSAGSTPPMSLCASPIFADRHSISAGKSHVFAGRPTGSAGRPVSAGRPSGSANRTLVPASRILGKFIASASFERFPQTSNVEISDIHDGLKIFNCPKSGIFTSFSYNEEFSGLDANNLESSLDVSSTITKRIHNIHPTSQILKNKKDARGIVCRNKAKLVAQGHRREEGINYTDVFALVARIKAIRLFLEFVSFMGFRVYQMDMKSAFLYGKIVEEVYVTQPRGFEDPDHPKKVYKVVKALYGLHQAPRAWYKRLSTFLLKHGYRRGTIYKTLFIKKDSKDIMLVQVYINDIIFGSTRKDWCEEFKTLMQSEFKMSSMGPLTFFLGLQVDQRPDGIFIHQEKHQVTPKTSNLLSVNRIFKYLTAYPKLGLWKSTIGGCQFFRRRLIFEQCKKQTIVATSSCEAEYVAAASCCGQLFPIPAGDLVSAGHMFFLLASVARQFWGSALEVSLSDGVRRLVPTSDGTAYTITEASIRSAL
nr:hypothetical protein [Tanacetum cinerariifolium]